ncbi:MAG TPA: SDR family oxidoreductase [Candidatus Binatia bacterium]|jgi:NAD(P)-dependent dehydrogenase (short-subunit alcohol dehydrogenase family)
MTSAASIDSAGAAEAVPRVFAADCWGLVLGGSSGIGLASARRLAAAGMSLVVVHRDRRAAMARIEKDFERLAADAPALVTLNVDALSAEGRSRVLDEAAARLQGRGRIRVLLHSIALGNLKPLSLPGDGTVANHRRRALDDLACALGIDGDALAKAVDQSFAGGCAMLHALATPADYGKRIADDEDFASTVHNMGTSLYTWVRDVHERALFAPDARVLALTSEGNTIAWRGYGAVSAAKAALEAVSRQIALELAPWGIRSNIVQAGITETPASALIPGIAAMKADAMLRNPLGRLTTPQDVADAVYLLCTDEARWINGSILRVDGGEHISRGACA